MSATAYFSPDLPAEACRLAARWWQLGTHSPRTESPARDEVPADPALLPAALVALMEIALSQGQPVNLLFPDDHWLAELSQALPLNWRPLCLLLPASDFTAPIALRATLSLLKSRLTRADDESCPEPWARQRIHLETHASTWQAALNWSAGEGAPPWPAETAGLFPLRVTAFNRQQDCPPAALTVQLFPPPQQPCPSGPVLQLQTPSIAAAFYGALVVADPTLLLQAEMDALTQEIADMELELATVQGELADFTLRYHTQVGRRVSALDQIKAQLAEALAEQAKRAQQQEAAAPGPARPKAAEAARAAEAAAQARAQAEQSKAEEARFHQAQEETEAPAFRPGDSLKKLFRQLAQKIHPDRANSEADRQWRTKLMSEANRAYRHGDASTLVEILQLWHEQPGGYSSPAHREETPQDALSRAQQAVGALNQRLREIQQALNQLFGSRLYELLLAERMARRAGRALLNEMAERLDREKTQLESRLSQVEKTLAPQPPHSPHSPS